MADVVRVSHTMRRARWDVVHKDLAVAIRQRNAGARVIDVAGEDDLLAVCRNLDIARSTAAGPLVAAPALESHGKATRAELVACARVGVGATCFGAHHLTHRPWNGHSRRDAEKAIVQEDVALRDREARLVGPKYLRCVDQQAWDVSSNRGDSGPISPPAAKAFDPSLTLTVAI